MSLCTLELINTKIANFPAISFFQIVSKQHIHTNIYFYALMSTISYLTQYNHTRERERDKFGNKKNKRNIFFSAKQVVSKICVKLKKVKLVDVCRPSVGFMLVCWLTW